jgi:hypothetical protein
MLGYIILGLLLVVMLCARYEIRPRTSHNSDANRPKSFESDDIQMPICNCAYPCKHYPEGTDPFGKGRIYPIGSDRPTPYMPPEQWEEMQRPWPKGTNPYSVEIEFVR